MTVLMPSSPCASHSTAPSFETENLQQQQQQQQQQQHRHHQNPSLFRPTMSPQNSILSKAHIHVHHDSSASTSASSTDVPQQKHLPLHHQASPSSHPSPSKLSSATAASNVTSKDGFRFRTIPLPPRTKKHNSYTVPASYYVTRRMSAALERKDPFDPLQYLQQHRYPRRDHHGYGAGHAYDYGYDFETGRYVDQPHLPLEKESESLLSSKQFPLPHHQIHHHHHHNHHNHRKNHASTKLELAMHKIKDHPSVDAIVALQSYRPRPKPFRMSSKQYSLGGKDPHQHSFSMMRRHRWLKEHEISNAATRDAALVGMEPKLSSGQDHHDYLYPSQARKHATYLSAIGHSISPLV